MEECLSDSIKFKKKIKMNIKSVDENKYYYDRYEQEYLPYSTMKRHKDFFPFYEHIEIINNEIMYFGKNGKVKCLNENEYNNLII